MREVVFVWIESYKNIKKQGFNFGSDYVYFIETDEKEGLIIDRKQNQNYIADFFQTDKSKNITNVSVFVGENGSGKSNFLDALRRILSDDRDWFGHIVVYKDEKGNLGIFGNVDVKKNFEEAELSPAFTETVFYSPSLDNKIYPIMHDENVWFDISTDWLIFKDYQEQKETKPQVSQIELFEAEEIERQLKLSYNKEFSDYLSTRINIPTEIEIKSLACEFPTKIEGSSIRNVPPSYRPFYDVLDNKIDIAIREYTDQESLFNKEHTIPENENPYTRKKCFVTFTNHLLKNLFWHMDSTGHYLSEPMLISLTDLDLLSYEDAVIYFIENANIIEDKQIIVTFINFTRKLIDISKAEYENFNEISWIVPKEQFKDFIEFKDKYLIQLSKFQDYGKPRSFINYSWYGISSGERAIFNLFSRFYFAKNKIIENIAADRYNNKKTPTMLYLLIDEAELGFHLQWQKEYFNDMIEYLPKTLEFHTPAGKVIPKIQLIFTTHSTLSLSDIPNSNITYIQKKDGIAYVLNEKEKPKKSFGANVHSLMTDSFFLRNGLVGSFAVNKINDVINLINKEKLTEEESLKINSLINIVDEPILKTKLQSMYIEKHSRMNKLDKLRRERSEIDEQIKRLEAHD